jgi:LysR family transcriptional activator of nhaA
MEWLNYHHLLYFWLVAREGGIARASGVLRRAHPTISGQIHELEDNLGEKLFTHVGRRLVLTDMGRVVYRYADEIFSLGQELVDTVKGRPTGRPLRLVVGVADAVPKLVVRRLLEPALAMSEPVRVVCREGKPARLLADLALQALDLVLADVPPGPAFGARVSSHLLADCGVSFLATAELAARLRPRFPHSLQGAPLLLPTDECSLRRSLDGWLSAHGIEARLMGEFDDSAALVVFGQAGHGAFPVPSAIEAAIRRGTGVELVGRVDEVRERFYAVAIERKLKHAAVVAVCSAVRDLDSGLPLPGQARRAIRKAKPGQPSSTPATAQRLRRARPRRLPS